MTEIKITRRIALPIKYEYYELEATYDPADTKGNKVIKDMGKTVALIRRLTATEEMKMGKGKFMKYLEKAAKIPTKKAEVGDTEDIKIADLKAKDKVNISVRLVDPIDPENDIKAFINKTDGSAGKRCKTIVEDASGKISLTLFDEQIDLVQRIKPNAWFNIENGYVKEYMGKLELVVGRYGNIESVFNG